MTADKLIAGIFVQFCRDVSEIQESQITWLFVCPQQHYQITGTHSVVQVYMDNNLKKQDISNRAFARFDWLAGWLPCDWLLEFTWGAMALCSPESPAPTPSAKVTRNKQRLHQQYQKDELELLHWVGEKVCS